MTVRTQVTDVCPGMKFRLLADWQIDGTDEWVPTADTLTAFDVQPDGTLIQIQTEVGTLSVDAEVFVDVVGEGD
jgi:hypothetical protein